MNARPSVLLAALAGVLVVALVGTTTVAVLQGRRLSAQQEEVEELQAEVTALRDQVERLEADRGDDPGTPLDGLLDGGLDDLLDGLLDGDGELGGLLDDLLSGASGDIPGLRCMTPEGGGIGELFGDLGGMLGGDRSSDVPDLDPDELVDVIADQVAALRELDFTDEVEVAFLDDDALTAEIEQILDDELDVDELAAEADVLAALRAIPAGADLEELTRELLTGQVAGFYAPEDERLVVRTPDGDAIRTMDRITLAHELDHALVDQAIGLPDLEEEIDADADLARLAVIEGDATLLMNRWTLEHLSLGDQIAIAGSPDVAVQQRQLEAFPHYLGRELLFPYTAGLDLVCDRWIEAGWDGVDAAYARPPTTTAGVLFPDRWDAEALAAPSLETPSGATQRLADSFGAAPLLWLFEAPGGDTDVALSDPLTRAAAWGGGEVRLWDLDGEPVVGLALTDRDAGGPDLCTSVTDWYAASAPDATRDGEGAEVRFVDGVTAAAIRCEGEAVRVAVAPDIDVAATVVGSR